MRCSRTRSGPTTWTMCRHDRPRATNEGTVNQHDAVEVITAKRDGGELSDSQIDWVIANYTSGEVADEKMSSLAMEILLHGMHRREIGRWTHPINDPGLGTDISSVPPPTRHE